MSRPRAILAWASLAAALIIPVAVAATSPFLSYRSWVYIAAGFAGIVALALILLQPLLVGHYLPKLSARAGRVLHRRVGTGLVCLVVLHVGGLWLTSPPDVIDALLFVSPTPFSIWGVLAMWALFAAAALALLRKPLRIRPPVWRFAHTALTLSVVVGSVVHTMLIEGAMGTVSKAVLCLLVLAATIKAMVDLRSWALLKRMRPGPSGRP
ncbi:ferric reductase [Fulvimarina sp. 2208YS6-2-32]|uniref:Ferric reductase n=1 Tax=Fulvimarina uroteuthidis TaxID=3098149 RepID=A0ABU5I3Z0_9HYPH|nr:ferric reductase-like transmembrane domain-containing protein [Fulvimarina sp. 2208YS6-2-32]MDY8109524.1 ferric reductase [Fulvimarina sp. 2208YS6-2-32]